MIDVAQKQVTVTLLENGLTVIHEHMPQSASVAYEFHVRGGILGDSEKRVGGSLVLGEILHRGAGSLGGVDLSNAFDALGATHHESVGLERFVLSGRAIAEAFPDALRLTLAMLREPHLPESELGSIKSLLLQDLRALRDDPSRLALVELDKRFFPAPWNRSLYGSRDGIEATSRDYVYSLWKSCFSPLNTIVSIAGAICHDAAVGLVRSGSEGWQGERTSECPFGSIAESQVCHLPYEGAQQQIAIAIPAPPMGDSRHYVARLANGLLSAGMFGRLFVEVINKRGLCYTVYSRYQAMKHFGAFIIYAGTTPERAHETLRVIKEQLAGLSENITQEELERVKTYILSSLVIRDESPGSRAATNANDYWLLGRVRALDEIKERLSSIAIQDIERYLMDSPLEPYTILTLGPL